MVVASMGSDEAFGTVPKGMTLHDCETKTHPLESIGQATLTTWKLIGGEWCASIGGPGISVTLRAKTPGHATLELADTLRALGLELGRIAFEAYGAVHLPTGRPRGISTFKSANHDAGGEEG